MNVLGGADEKPTSLEIPLAVAGFWNRIAENVDSVTETGSETLQLNGAPDCLPGASGRIQGSCRCFETSTRDLFDLLG